jgi:hypothetical protein
VTVEEAEVEEGEKPDITLIDQLFDPVEEARKAFAAFDRDGSNSLDVR